MSKSVLIGLNEKSSIGMVEAARKEFNVPVVSVVLFQYVDADIRMSEQDISEFGPYYSVPDFYFENIQYIKSLSLDELSALQVKLEQELGVENGNMLTSYDRCLMVLENARSVQELQVIYLMLTKKITSENDILFCAIGYGFYLWQVLSKAFLGLGVPVMAYYFDRLTSKRMIALDPLGQQLGMQQAFETLQNGDQTILSPETMTLAESYYESFIKKPRKPSYSNYRSRSIFRSIKHVFTSGVKSILTNMKMYNENVYDRECGRLESSLNNILEWPGRALTMAIVEKGRLLNSAPDLSRNYIYLPLHHSPEISDMFYGSNYDHHEGFVAQLSKRIPSGYSLYVKENAPMIGRRPLSFYKNLKKYHNVEIISSSVSTFDLINNGVTLTVTGTAGWEAFLLGRPCVVLGNVFYNFLPGVLDLDLYDLDFTKKLVEYINEFNPDTNNCLHAVQAYFESSVALDDQLDVLDESSIFLYRKQCVRSWGVLFEKWGQWILKNDPRTTSK